MTINKNESRLISINDGTNRLLFYDVNTNEISSKVLANNDDLVCNTYPNEISKPKRKRCNMSIGNHTCCIVSCNDYTSYYSINYSNIYDKLYSN